MTASYIAILAGCVAFALLAGIIAGRMLKLPWPHFLAYGLVMALIVLAGALLTKATYA